MSDIIQGMLDRRSIRAYTDEVPSRELIDQVVEAGLWAASGMNRQGPIIVAVTNRELRNRLSAMNAEVIGDSSRDPFYGAPVVLVVLAPRGERNRVYDGSLVMGNLMLAAHALGLGSCWIHRAREEFDTPRARPSSPSWASRETTRASATASWGTRPRRRSPSREETVACFTRSRPSRPRVLLA